MLKQTESSINNFTYQENSTNFTSILIHELRNPLTILKSILQLIESKEPNIKSIKYWDQIDCLITDMEEIMTSVNQLTAFDKVNIQTSDLNEMIIDLYNQYKPISETNKINLTLQIDERTHDILKEFPCDMLRIKQALSNIIKNAFEATKVGDDITINFSSSYSDGNYLVINIANNGAQIPQEIINNIFIPHITCKKDGHGIGLALVHKIILLHKGEISVKSSESLTEFIISLPF